MSIEKQDYFKQGQTWDQEIIAHALTSRTRAWIVTAFALMLAVLSLITLLCILPLKTFAPYVITVDQHTGYYEVTKGLKDAALTSEEAITQSNLVRYVSMREQYNPSILKENYAAISGLSSGTALQDFQILWSATNPDNPSIKLGPKTKIDIKISSVSFIRDDIAQVRFLKSKRTLEGDQKSYWIAIIEFEYAGTPMPMGTRFENPLGFKVTRYSVNPETLENFP